MARELDSFYFDGQCRRRGTSFESHALKAIVAMRRGTIPATGKEMHRAVL